MIVPASGQVTIGPLGSPNLLQAINDMPAIDNWRNPLMDVTTAWFSEFASEADITVSDFLTALEHQNHTTRWVLVPGKSAIYDAITESHHEDGIHTAISHLDETIRLYWYTDASGRDWARLYEEGE